MNLSCLMLSQSVGPPLWVQTETYQQLLDGLPWHFVQIFVVIWGWRLLTLVIPWLYSSATMRITFLVLSEMSQWLLNGFAWNLLQIFMVPRGYMCPTDFGVAMTFLLAPHWHWRCVILSEMSQQLWDWLPWNWVHTFISPSGWILIMLYFS